MTRFSLPALSISFGFVLMLSASETALAQSAYCSGNAFSLQAGLCTNGNTGAFSGAALASQALGDLSEGSSQQTNLNVTSGIANRREEERKRNLSVSAGVAPLARKTKVVRERTRVTKMVHGQKRTVFVEKEVPVTSYEKPVYQEPAFITQMGPRFGVWGSGFGDYERRTATGASTIGTPGVGAVPGTPAGPAGPATPGTAGVAGVNVPLLLTLQSDTRTAGFVGGADYTFRSVLAPNDGFIVGILTGYISSDVRLNATAVSTNLGLVGNGFAHMLAQLSGGSVGAYATYFNNGFSADATVKYDFSNLSETFQDNRAFVVAPPAGTPSLLVGGGSANVTTGNFIGNVNYRFYLSPFYWLEPTAGVDYTYSNFNGSGAAALGLASSYLVRVQGGARIGTDSLVLGAYRLSVSLTGLAYDDVVVRGGFIPGAGYNSNAANDLLAQSDQGRVRGQGILAANLDLGHGISTFAQANVRGGSNLFGVGGRAGIRYQW
jgi:hypothetical protein